MNIETWLHVESDTARVPIPFAEPYAADVSTANVLTGATYRVDGYEAVGR